jgi:hypothetical protein
MAKLRKAKMELELKIEVVSGKEIDASAWDQASDIVADCLVNLLKKKVQEREHADKL